MALSRITNYIEADGADLNLQSSDTTITASSVLGVINFKAPSEASGTDAILLASKIEAVAEGTFSASSNATKLSFATASSEAAAEKMALSSGGDLSIVTDGASIFFGADSEIELRHVADDGLIIKHVGTGDGKEPSLTFQAGDNDIAQDDILGQINFQAPDEGAGTDAVLIASTIKAFSEGDFSSSNNATTLEFSTGRSAAAGSDGGRLRLTSAGVLELKNQNTADGSKPVFHLQAGDTDIAQDDELGVISFSAPDEGTGTDAITVAAQITAVSEGDFSSSNNATSLVFKTGASGAASDRVKISSVGVLSIPADASDLTGTTNAIHLGASADMKIFHNSGNNYILTDQATQSFTVLSDIVRFNTRDNGENLFGATLDAGFFAKFDNTTTFQTISGGVQIDGDIVFGNSANGINLGVTSNTDSNTLDDYEEGTFTASANGFSGTFSSIQYEYYTKVGQQVFYGLRISGRSNTADNTQANFSGFPFSAYAEHPAAVGMNDSDFGHAMVNTAEILYFYSTTGGDFTYSTWPHTTGYARVQGSYRTA